MTEPDKRPAEVEKEGARVTPLPLYHDEEIENLQRVLIFSIGVSAGLILALHLILREKL